MSVAKQAAAYTLDPYDLVAARGLSAALGVSDPVAAVLVRRGFDTPATARAFLAADEVHDPFEFDSMEEVVARILDAARAGRRITVHGDYDVDGVCSASILVSTFRDLGAECDWYLPSRLEDGYGLSAGSVSRLAERGTEMLVTADCGVGSIDEVRMASAAGMEVIVTDHHEPGEALPECAILHPRISNYPCPDLCATGVAFKLSQALRVRANAGDAARDLDLAALATVADLVPLRGENRALVRAGLAEIRRGHRPGMRALMAASAVDPGRVDEGDLAFRLAPRINAAGRLYRADSGVELMITQDQGRADAIATELDRANHERRDTEREALQGAEAAVRELPMPPAEAGAVVVVGEGWHPGVVGIVASRLVETHYRPTVVIGLRDGGRGRGSARSIPGFDLLSGLRACDRHLVAYGGHEAAAGLEIEPDQIDAFREAFCEHARALLSDAELVRSERIDAVVGGESLGMAIAEELEGLAPFGKGNPEVNLLVPAARVRDVRPMGEEGKHARFSVESGSRRALGVAFGTNGSLARAGEGPHDLAVRLEVNHWNGAVEPRVILREIYPLDLEPAAAVDPLATDACTNPAPSEEWWQRFETELDHHLEAPDPAPEPFAGAREVIDCRGHSAVALIASLLSSGAPVLALCAQTSRRRGLAERAADPARFGGGQTVLACASCTGDGLAERVRAVIDAGRGLVLADWATLDRHPALADGFGHVVLVDPAPSERLESIALASSGHAHLAWGAAEVELASALHEIDWAPRNALAALYVTLRDRGGDLEADEARVALAGRGAHPLTPEQAARRCRVLAELGLIAFEANGANRSLRVVSSVQSDLERSEAFRAYRARYEEGRQFLNSRRAQT